jgi:radical SAM/Cys-rich protein
MVPCFEEKIRKINPDFLCFDKFITLQVNLGNICNQSCEICHLAAGPAGKSIMNEEVMEKIIMLLHHHGGLILDITGGCPELNPYFKSFVEKSCGFVSRLMVRTNLTILTEQDMAWVPEWYSRHQVVLMGSLPCYTEENVDRQRGNGVFKKSIDALRKLNELGYGSSLELNLIYNPARDSLPGSQKMLEDTYREKLFEDYGIRFNNLFTITNAPLGRFRSYLESSGKTEHYFKMLLDNFNPDTAGNIMCRTLINIDWQGILYNCDFNQAAGLPMRSSDGNIMAIDDLKDAIQKGHEIVRSDHCYCCTAGAGSSCTGVLVS